LGFELVVGDVKRGRTHAALQELELNPHFVSQPGIEVGNRLVENRTVGLRISARPSATRCFWPPLSATTGFSSSSSI
jgi:hypothetical protein